MTLGELRELLADVPDEAIVDHADGMEFRPVRSVKVFMNRDQNFETWRVKLT